MRMTIAILEDNHKRIATMRDCLADKLPFYDQRFFPSSQEVIEWLRSNLDHTICISLDHDLERLTPDTADPGSGREVADFLASRSPRCPVILHTTNVPASAGMEMVLKDAGWITERIVPYDDIQWIGQAWLPLVRQLIVASAVPDESAHLRS